MQGTCGNRHPGARNQSARTFLLKPISFPKFLDSYREIAYNNIAHEADALFRKAYHPRSDPFIGAPGFIFLPFYLSVAFQ